MAVLPWSTPRRFYGYGIPNLDLNRLAGKLIVVEGADGSGRSTQIARLRDWLEGCGHATVQVGLKRSTLVSEELDQAQTGNILSHTTLSLFYATDFADQLENIILPSLKAGFMVLADRYIYTLMARDLVRGMDEGWLKNLYGVALVPDAVFYLNVSPEHLVQRTLQEERCRAGLLGKRDGPGAFAGNVRQFPEIPGPDGPAVQAVADHLWVRHRGRQPRAGRNQRGIAAEDCGDFEWKVIFQRLAGMALCPAPEQA